MRVVLDTNAIDPIIDLPGALDAVKSAIAAGKLEVLITPAGRQEIADTRNVDRRVLLEQILEHAGWVADGAFILGRSALGQARLGSAEAFEAIRAGNKKNTDDALITMAAMYENVALVTNDRRLRPKAEALGVEVLGSLEFLARIGYQPPAA